MLINRALRGAQELWPSFVVAVMVALISTLVGSVFDHVHQVNAEEEQTSPVILAAAHPQTGTQTVTISRWGVQFTLPLNTALPRLSLVDHVGSGLGLSSADLVPLGPACSAARDALGTLLRFPHGSSSTVGRGPIPQYTVAVISNYDYVYQMPQNDCANQSSAQPLINRETSVISEALSSLAPIPSTTQP